jgi:hypothetical protein
MIAPGHGHQLTSERDVPGLAHRHAGARACGRRIRLSTAADVQAQAHGVVGICGSRKHPSRTLLFSSDRLPLVAEAITQELAGPDCSFASFDVRFQ